MNSDTVDSLTAQFALPGLLDFDQPQPGMLRARIDTPACQAELYLHGAHLTAWQPAGYAPVIFLSPRTLLAPGKAIRGGVPIIFPWFGPRAATASSTRTDGPAHGFARIEDWTLAFAALSGEDLHLTLTLAPSAQAKALGFDSFRLAFQLILGRTLTMRLTVANEAAAPLEFQEAFHTYFTVSDAETIRITGLADTEYIDKADSFIRKTQTDPIITFKGQTDRPYLNTTSTVTIDDPGLHRRIVVAKSNSHTTVVWNPGEALSATIADLGPDVWRNMACVETANALENAITLAPAAAHTMETRISVEPHET